MEEVLWDRGVYFLENLCYGMSAMSNKVTLYYGMDQVVVELEELIFPPKEEGEEKN